MDTIHIRQLKLACIIGTEARERRRKQAVVVSVRLHGDFRKAGRSDRLADAVDYAAMRDRIAAAVQVSRCQLLEALAQAVADVCLAESKVAAVEVLVEKPGALAGRGAVAVEIRRRRK
jgi:dihydroneopterin aldolase